jgi:hypothetical protein
MRRQKPIETNVEERAFLLAVRRRGAGAEFIVRDDRNNLKLQVSFDDFDVALAHCDSFVQRLKRSDPTALVILDIDEKRD